jgi:hypothetical protein
LPGFTDDVRRRDAAVVEKQFTGGGGADAHLVFFVADGEARGAALDEEGGNAAIASLRD